MKVPEATGTGTDADFVVAAIDDGLSSMRTTRGTVC